MKGPRFRFSRTLVLIMGGIVVFGGGSGAAAVIIGTDKILGPSYRELNGLECTTLETIRIRRDQRYWVRKYVTSDKAGDGPARLKTALRVAQAVQKKEKADLVQVAMVDKAGPTDRARMRGRMVGAQVVYIPDPEKVPEGIAAQTYSAYYLDGSANANGEYYGMRIDLPLEDVETLSARLTDNADCFDPKAAVSNGEHAAPAAGHGEAPGHGESAGQEKTPGHAEEPTAGGHGVPAEDHGDEVAAKESSGLLSSVTSMIFGSRQETPAEPHAPKGKGHAAASAEGHSVPADGHGEATATEDHGDQAVTAEQAIEPEKEEGGFLASVKSMIFGNGEDAKPAPSHDEASADRHAPEAPSPAPEPRTAAEGGKRWSNASEADEIRSDHASPEASYAEAAPPPADGSTEADAAGAAWLAKFRGQPAAVPANADGDASATGQKTDGEH
ncbi:hypothetical protein [Neorhizobium sp. DT-125]|uniref:hypothetical protein n=1 Tax=Neorhizobium sp. DT-125 TaxID=3396163 RepID=UPI003F1B9088